MVKFPLSGRLLLMVRLSIRGLGMVFCQIVYWFIACRFPRMILCYQTISSYLSSGNWKTNYISSRNHKIIPELGTAERNHIVFPGVDGKKKRLKPSLKEEEEARKRRLKLLAEKRSTLFGSVTERIAVKMGKKVEECPLTHGDLTKKFVQGPREVVGSKVTDVTMNSLRANNAAVQTKACKPFKGDNSHSSLGNNHSVPSMRPFVVRPKMHVFSSGKTKNTVRAMPAMEKASKTLPSVDTELEKRYCTCLSPMFRHAA